MSNIPRTSRSRRCASFRKPRNTGRRGACCARKPGLNEDAATRGAALGRIYDTLSFDLLAIEAGTDAVETAPANPGAHRFLADAYRTRREYEIAQTSELLVSQLLSPPSKTPVQPELAETRLALLDTTGPARVTFAEFAPLFDADGLALTGSGLAGTQDTLGGEYAVTGLYRNASISVGQYHFETDGYRDNNDLEHDIFDAVSTFAVTPEFSFFGEYRYRETEGGDRQIDFNIDDFDPTVRERNDEGGRAHRLSCPADLQFGPDRRLYLGRA